MLHPDFVPVAHGLGMYVHVWTINDEADMRMLIEDYGVDGIMTDDPPLLTKVITELGARRLRPAQDGHLGKLSTSSCSASCVVRMPMIFMPSTTMAEPYLCSSIS